MNDLMKQFAGEMYRLALEAGRPRCLGSPEVPDSKRILTLESMRDHEDPIVAISPEIFEVAESMDFENPAFSWKGLRRMATKEYRRLGESNASTAFGQLLRAGIQTVANGWYKRTEIYWPEYIGETSSDKRQEFHAPLYNSQLPKRTGPGVPYQEQRVKGVDREIINYKYMGGESFERELFDDDQTGQIRQRAQQLGEGARLLEEIYAAGRMLGTAQTIAGVDIPVSTYTTTNSVSTAITTPFSVNIYGTSDGNRPATFVQLSFPALKVAFEQLLNAKDPLGIKIAAKPDTLVYSGFDFINVRTFLNSTWYPAVQGQAGLTQNTAVSGFAGTIGAENPMKGLMNPSFNIYLPRGAWYLGTAHKGLIMQRRDPVEITQELPQAGQSFDTDSYRFRTRSRWEFEWIDSRFWYCGNDGTASCAQ